MDTPFPSKSRRTHSIPTLTVLLSAMLLAVLMPIAPGLAQAQESDDEQIRAVRAIRIRGDGDELFVTRDILHRGGFLGVSLNNLTPELRAHFGTPEDQGVLIARVVEDSAAEAAGLQVGDVLTAVAGSPIDSVRGAIREISRRDGGEAVELEIYREGQIFTFEATLEEHERASFDFAPLLQFRSEHGEGLEGLRILGPEGLVELDQSTLHEAMERLRDTMSNPEWKARMEGLAPRRRDLLERLDTLEERIRDLESQLEDEK